MPSVLVKKYDPALYLLLAVLFAASVFCAAYPGGSGDDFVVEVARDGKIVLSENPGGPGEKDISTMTFGEPGNFNEIAISDGAWMVSADCPGGDCLRTGEIKKNGEMIVCVPHRLLIRIVSSQRPEVDAVSR